MTFNEILADLRSGRTVILSDWHESNTADPSQFERSTRMSQNASGDFNLISQLISHDGSGAASSPEFETLNPTELQGRIARLLGEGFQPITI
ncbi:hypothetical protein GCM10022235_82660 [Kribbella ginsengisoli]|uniref:Uncharacterized protein n=1 Tax=Kribbella ginsengisoli TaxID=363865 RepID=A0ABP6Z487_9ACTN